MISFLTVIFGWALKNQMITGLFAFVGSKLYVLFEEYIKRRFFPLPQQVTVETIKQKLIVKKTPRVKDVIFGRSLLIMIFILLIYYTVITYAQFPHLKSSQIVEELEKIKLFVILFTIFLAAKLLSYNATLKEVIETLPIVNKFFKK